MTMDVKDVAADFTRLCKEGAFAEAGETYWSSEIVSLEPIPGPHSTARGLQALQEKHAWWSENSEEHGFAVEGPFLHGDQFAVIFELDVTMKGYPRERMREVGLYTVRDGRIVEERFFAAS